MNVYDFDHTIYDGDSSADFYWFALGKKPYLAALLPLQVWGMIRYLSGTASKEVMKEAFFVFVRCIQVRAMVSDFWERNRAKLKPWYLAQKKDSDLIISASPEFLLEPVVRGYLGVRLIASRIDPLTGKYGGRNCYGAEKAARLRVLYPDAVIDDFYSDSLSDAPLAEKAQCGFMVKGSRLIPWREYKMTLFEKIKQTYFTKEFILFVFCGGMGTLTNFIVSLIVSQAVNPTVAYVFGYAISLLAAYTLNAKLIFRSALGASQFAKFLVSYIPNFIILFLFVAIFLNILRWNKVLVYGLAGLLGLPLTFILVKIFAFTEDKNDASKNH